MMLQIGFDLISKVPAKNSWSSSHHQAEFGSDAIVLKTNKRSSSGLESLNCRTPPEKMDVIHKPGFSEEESGKIPY